MKAQGIGSGVHREGQAVLAAGLLFGLFTTLRLFLIAFHWSALPHEVVPLARAFLLGAGMDLAVALWLTFPFVLYLALVPSRVQNTRAHQIVSRLLLTGALFVAVFLVVADFFFFDEFNAHFNYIAVDYVLVSPREVLGNLWQSYPMGAILSLMAVFVWVLQSWFKRFWQISRLGHLSLTFRILLVSGWFAGASVAALACDIRLLNDGANRLLDEVGANGFYTLYYALKTNNLAYDAFYPKLPVEEAFSRVRARLKLSVSDEEAVTRWVPPRKGLGKVNVVVILEESLGSKFVGALGNTPGYTPALDALSKRSLFFRRIYSTGTRTVRGLEAVLTSFPPIPGASIVKRDGADGLASLPSVLKALGYQTAFVYGGRGLFDNMRHFALANGFDRFVEQKDFRSPTFTTIWGVSDEDIFNKSLETLDGLNAAGRPFFVTILTVSNHKPYTYPSGRIDADPTEHRREHAVQYADWALGDFFRKAEGHAFFDRTLFVVLGDHGARVYGADFIPIASYEIPLLFFAPKLMPPRTVDTLAGSIDVAPTILGLLGVGYPSTFLGRDILANPESNYAFLQHDRDVGLLEDNHLAVLGPQQSAGFFQYDRPTHLFFPVQAISVEGRNLISDAISFYQTAYRLFALKRYHT